MQQLTDLRVGSVLVQMELGCLCDLGDLRLLLKKQPEAEILGAICIVLGALV